MSRFPPAPDNFDFLSPAKVVFGWGRFVEAGRMARELGQRAFVVTGSRRLRAAGVVDALIGSLDSAGVACHEIAQITHEPEVPDVDAAVARLSQVHAMPGDLVIALGGGSALDLAKALAALAAQAPAAALAAQAPTAALAAQALTAAPTEKSDFATASVRDYLEGVGRGLNLAVDPLPVLAIPTTAGTGSEATKNAVISSYDPPFKKSLRSDRMIPRAVLLDPQLTVSVSRETTAWTGMDAITQLIESFITRRGRSLARAVALEGLRQAVGAIETAVREGQNQPAREAMSYAAFLSGMALANSGLGLAHGVAAALGVVGRVPHGLACAVMLPAALRVNRDVREDDYATLARAIGVAHDATSTPAAADAFVRRVERLCAVVGVPRKLSELGIRPDQIDLLVPASRGNSMNGNPRDVSDDELRTLLKEML